MPLGTNHKNNFDIGRDPADATIKTGVYHVVLSTLENVDQITTGTKFALHLTHKARVEAYIRTLPVCGLFIELSIFYINLPGVYPHVKRGFLAFFRLHC